MSCIDINPLYILLGWLLTFRKTTTRKCIKMNGFARNILFSEDSFQIKDWCMSFAVHLLHTCRLCAEDERA